MSINDIDKKTLEIIVQKIIELEKENLKNNDLNKNKIVREIKKIIEKEVKID